MLTALAVSSQNVGINIGYQGNLPDNSAILHLDVSGGPPKGLLIPMVSLSSTTDQTTIPSPAHGLIVFNTNPNMTGGNGQGFYYWDTTGTDSWRFMLVTSNGPGSAGQVLVSQGPGLAPQWSSTVPGAGDNTGANITMFTAIKGFMDWPTCYTTCRNATDGGYTDWRMPTVDEVMWRFYTGAIPLPGGICNCYIWTASPSTNPSYWIIYQEGTPSWSAVYYNSNYYCRCVR